MSTKDQLESRYLMYSGVLPRLHAVIAQVLRRKPLPYDPLMEVLHAIGAPLIPQAQMKSLERQVSRAHHELRRLQRILIDIGGESHLYVYDPTESCYVGQVGQIASFDFIASTTFK